MRWKRKIKCEQFRGRNADDLVNDVSTIRYLQNFHTTSLPSFMKHDAAHEMCTWNSHELHLVEIDCLAKLNQRLGIEIEMLKSSNSKCQYAARLRNCLCLNFVTKYFTRVRRISTDKLRTKIHVPREIGSRSKRHFACTQKCKRFGCPHRLQ